MESKDFDTLKYASALALKQAVDAGNLYVFVGKTSEWTDEPTVDAPVNSDNNLTETQYDMKMLQKLSASDCQLALPRIAHEIDVVYDEYDADDDELLNKQFFVVTSTNNVYKCLSNNNGAVSTVRPTGTSVNPVLTADGYTWKYMYTIPSGYLNKFNSANFMAVPTLTDKTSAQLLVEQSATPQPSTPIGGHGKNAAVELKARSVIISKTLDFSGNPELLAVVQELRQFGLILRPTDTLGNLLTDDNYVVGNETTNQNAVSIYGGQVLNVTNFSVVDITVDGEMTIEFVIQF